MISESEAVQLAEVFASVLDSRLKVLYTELANMCVEVLNQFASDLAEIMNAQTRQHVNEIRERMAKQAAQIKNQAAARSSKVGFL